MNSANDEGTLTDGKRRFVAANQLTPNFDFQDFTCDDGGFYAEVTSVGCSGCDDLKNQQCS